MPKPLGKLVQDKTGREPWIASGVERRASEMPWQLSETQPHLIPQRKPFPRGLLCRPKMEEGGKSPSSLSQGYSNKARGPPENNSTPSPAPQAPATGTSRLWWGKDCSQHRWKPKGHTWLLWFSPDAVEPRLEGRISKPRCKAPGQSPPRLSPPTSLSFPVPSDLGSAFGLCFCTSSPSCQPTAPSPTVFGQGLGSSGLGF